jgi:hypothetical protein
MRDQNPINQKQYHCVVRHPSGVSSDDHVVQAPSGVHAQLLLKRQLGDVNIISVLPVETVSEASSTDNAQDSQADYMNRQAAQLRSRAKLAKARKSLERAQQQLRDSNGR